MKKKILIILGIVFAVALITAAAILGPKWYVQHADYGFHTPVSPQEEAARLKLLSIAESWLGANEADGSHRTIVDLYNGHEPLAQGYLVTYEDNWCATFVSAVAIEAGYTHFIPTECGCERQIGLFRELGRWVEDDAYVPLPGDIIYYSMAHAPLTGDCTAWSDHVGLVVGTAGNYLKVIEGNCDDQVTYRYIKIDDNKIRGYAIPDYTQALQEETHG
jgi:hypothetical protein